MTRFNFHQCDLERDEGAPDGVDAVGADIGSLIGAEHLGGTVFEVGPGRKGYPYHWEAAQEEWLLVLVGTPTIRTPQGEQELRPGDLVAFAAGPDGAHQVLNPSDAPVRFLMLSNRSRPNVVVYPDSGKIGLRGDLGLPGPANYALDATLGYWEGES
jgi:uncharacterized cupin superfamily protein